MKSSLSVTSLVIAALLAPLCVAGRSAAGEPPAKYTFLIGEWEAQIPDYEYRMRVEWDKTNNVFKGYLTKNTPAAENFGFELKEHVWTALPMTGPDALVDVQKWRYGANGVSTKVEWKVGLVDMEKSAGKELVKPSAKFIKVN